MKKPEFQKNLNLVKYHVRNGQLVRSTQVGAVMIMDIMLWGGIVLAVMAFVLWMKKSGLPGIQGWQEASTVSANIKKMADIYSGAASFTGLNNAAVAGNDNIFPAKYRPGGNVIQNMFGGQVTVGTDTLNVTNDLITYQDTLIPSAACVTLANQLADDVDRITIAGQIVKAVGGAINPTTLNTNCNSAASVTMIVAKLKTS